MAIIYDAIVDNILSHDHMLDINPDYIEFSTYIINSNALILQKAGNLDGAKILLEKSLEIRINNYGRNSIEVLDSFAKLHNISIILKDYHNLDNYSYNIMSLMQSIMYFSDDEIYEKAIINHIDGNYNCNLIEFRMRVQSIFTKNSSNKNILSIYKEIVEEFILNIDELRKNKIYMKKSNINNYFDEEKVPESIRSDLFSEIQKIVSSAKYQLLHDTKNQTSLKEHKINKKDIFESGFPTLPAGLSWPTEKFGSSPEAHTPNGIIRYLERVWSRLIGAGFAERRIAERIDPTVISGIKSFNRSRTKTREIPDHLRFLSVGEAKALRARAEADKVLHRIKTPPPFCPDT